MFLVVRSNVIYLPLESLFPGLDNLDFHGI